MRPLAIIEAELNAASLESDKLRGIVSALTAERNETRRCRDLAVLADFDLGIARKPLAHKHGLNENTLASIMHRNGRSYRKKYPPIDSLPAEQQRIYRKAMECGSGPKAARQMALAVTP